MYIMLLRKSTIYTHGESLYMVYKKIKNAFLRILMLKKHPIKKKNFFPRGKGSPRVCSNPFDTAKSCIFM